MFASFAIADVVVVVVLAYLAFAFAFPLLLLSGFIAFVFLCPATASLMAFPLALVQIGFNRGLLWQRLSFLVCSFTLPLPLPLPVACAVENVM